MSGNRELFRLALPRECISFYSEEGKVIFAEALATGHMNCYFKLAAQFRTQDEPVADCGLSTLVMILNAFGVDPGVVWKSPWRWYHETMLDCSTPISKGKRKTMSMEQFASVANCNSLDASIVHTDSNSEEDFRETIKEQTQRDDSFLVVSYSRESLQQNGNADFSAVGGYHPTKDVILLFDTARFKYPPCWIKLPFLLQAMNTTDKFTGQSRGFIILEKKLNRHRQYLFHISDHILPSNPSEIPSDVLSFLQQWTSYLNNKSEQTKKNLAIQKNIEKFVSLVENLKAEHMLLDINKSGKIPKEYGQELLHQVEKTHVFRRISQKFKSSNLENPPQRTENDSNIKRSRRPSRRKRKLFSIEHVLSLLLLSWPFCCTFQGQKDDDDDDNDEVCVGRILAEYIRHQFLLLVDPLKAEVIQLSHQLSVRLHLSNLGT